MRLMLGSVVAAVVVAAIVLAPSSLLPPRPLAVQPAVPWNAQAIADLFAPERPAATQPAPGGAFVVTLPGPGDCRLVLQPIAQAAHGAVTSANLAIRVEGQGCDGRDQAWIERLRVSDRQAEGIRPGGDVPPLTAWDRLNLGLAAAVLGALLVLGPVHLGRRPRAERRLWLAAFALALLARALWPHRLVAVYFAYEWFAHAHFHDALPRYGPGSTALWSLVLGPLAVDHAAILWLHAVLGAVSVATWAAWLARARSLRAGAIGAVVLGLTPLLLRDHTSESMHVPVQAALALACHAALDRTRTSAWIAALALAFAGFCRADAMIPALATVLALAWTGRPLSQNETVRKFPHPWPWLVGGGLLLLSLASARQRALADMARGNLPQLQGLWGQLGDRLRDDVILWRADWLPVAAWLPVLAWLALGREASRGPGQPGPDRHHRWLILPLVAGLWVVPSWLDYNETSLPRLQAPAALLLLLAAVALLDQVAELRWPRAVLAGGVALLAVSAVPTLAACLHQTNAHVEDDLLREVAAKLPKDRPYWLITRTFAEPPASGVHLHFPNWLFQPPGGPGRVVPASVWLQRHARGQLPDVPVYFFRSLRCYAWPVAEIDPKLPSREQPACRQLANLAEVQALFEREVPNLRDLPTFDYYGGSATLRVGLYRMPPGDPR